MRVLKYTLVDFLKVKNKLGIFFLLVPACALFMGAGSKVMGTMAVVYCLFAGIIIAGMPYYYEKSEEMGFFYLLPGRTEEQVFGHFLFGSLSLLAGLGLGVFCYYASSLFHAGHGTGENLLEGISANGSGMAEILVLLFGAGLICVAVQDFFCTLFRFESVQVMNLMRMIPGFIFFFGLSMLLANGDKTPQEMLQFLFSHSIEAFLFCLAAFLLTAFLSSMIAKSRE